MNKLVVIYGAVLIASTAIADQRKGEFTMDNPVNETAQTLENELIPLNIKAVTEPTIEDSFVLDLNTVEYVEFDAMELDFDTADYLPEGFDPYQTYFDLDSIPFVEENETLALGFDTKPYLPENFDAYSEVVPVGAVNYIEDEDFALGFDTSAYLPEGFNPYEFHLDLSTIPYIEDEDEMVWPAIDFALLRASQIKTK
ncbi:MAG: hypothetical protein AAGD88_06535 [Bacteroidota bacterium]